jgi:putative mRNA 3-end processing factor
MASFLERRPEGLYCPPGKFHLDPVRAVERAVITHGHSDHARRGHRAVLCAAPGAPFVRERIGTAPLETLPFGERRTVGEVTLSFHPAGHIRGSAQVRVEHRGEVAVITGDFKRHPDPVAEPFEPVPCHTLVTECTFGLPLYRWPDPEAELAALRAWWAQNRADGRASVLLAYSLGKAQRLLAALDPVEGPLLCDAAIERFNVLHRRHGVALPPTLRATEESLAAGRGRALALLPPSALAARRLRHLGPHAVAAASGWMLTRAPRRQRGLDRGFVLSDHADWPGLLATVRDTGAATVWAVHGFSAAFARHCRELGLLARDLDAPPA